MPFGILLLWFWSVSAACENAAEIIREHWPHRPVVGLVLGSGWNRLVDTVSDPVTFDAGSLPGMPPSTATGHRGRFVCGMLSGLPVIVQDGRIHRYEGHDFATCARPVRLMAELGIRFLIVTNASGGVNPDYCPGDVMLIEDHINLMWGNPVAGCSQNSQGRQVLDMREPYDAELRDALMQAAARLNEPVRRGVYLALMGPSYETPAEYLMVRRLGADVVGMSTVPEVLAARQAGVRVLGLSIVANVFRPDDLEGTSGDAVVAQVADAAPRAGRLIEQLLAGMAAQADDGRRVAVVSEAAGSAGRPASARPATSATGSPAATAAVLTASGRGAVAVIRVTGDGTLVHQAIDARFRAANGRACGEQAVNRLCYGIWSERPGSDGEDVVVCRTGPGTVEIHCHGGPVPIRRILGHLAESRVPTVDWKCQVLPDDLIQQSTPWMSRVNDKAAGAGDAAGSGDDSRAAVIPAIDMECRDVLTRATTERTAMFLLTQAQGVLRKEVEQLLSAADRLCRKPDLNAPDSEQDLADAAEVVRRIQRLLSRAEFGIHLVEPWRVVLIGRPNVGKSTLLNALLGYSRAIVFDEPGTTRDIVTGETALDGWPILLTDTAGMRETGGSIEQEGIRRTRQSLRQADLVCVLFDSGTPWTQDNDSLLTEVTSTVAADRTVLIAHKADRPSPWPAAQLPEVLRVSSVSGQGIEELMALIPDRLIGAVPSMESPVPVTPRQVKLFQAAHDHAVRAHWAQVKNALAEIRDGYSPEEGGS